MTRQDDVQVLDESAGSTEQSKRQKINFLESIRTGIAPASNFDQAVSLTKILMAIYESSVAGAEVCPWTVAARDRARKKTGYLCCPAPPNIFRRKPRD